MIYHGHILKKIKDNDVIGGHYYEIYKDGKWIVNAWTLSNAKEFIDSYDGKNYEWNILC